MKSPYDQLDICIVHDRHRKLLAVVEKFPGLQADMYSYDSRLNASALLEAADRKDEHAIEQCIEPLLFSGSVWL